MKVLAGLVISMVLGGVVFGQAVVGGAGVADGMAAGKRPMTFADLQRMKRVSDPQVSPSGKWVMFSVVDVDLAANTKTSHLWVVPLGGSREEGVGNRKGGTAAPSAGLSGGGERQITFWKDGESGGRFSPDGKKVLFVSVDG